MSPLPLLGTFHELSIATDDVRGAVEFYERLGFAQASTSDAFTHPYGVLTDGRVFLGLHRRAGPAAVLTFVRAGIAQHLAQFDAAGLATSHRALGEDVFHRIGLEDPAGNALEVLEARTYSPATRAAHETSLCGDFAEISLPAADFAAARAFWEPLGFVAADEEAAPYPHLPLTSDYLDLSFHPPRLCASAMLVFRDPDMPARLERLRAAGFELGTLGRGAGAPARLLGPDATPLVLMTSQV
jgi:catechol 2,3-dioxygenase-like lactoylglutathione lyase family enzyme